MFGAFFALVFLVVPASGEPWKKHETSLNGLKGKIQAREDDILKLIDQKEHAKPKQLNAILLEIAKKYQEAQKYHDEFNEEQVHIRYEHPERGEEVDRKYKAFRLRSLKQMETDSGIEKRLNRLREKINVTYKADMESIDSAQPSPTPRAHYYRAPTPTPTPDERVRISF